MSDLNKFFHGGKNVPGSSYAKERGQKQYQQANKKMLELRPDFVRHAAAAQKATPINQFMMNRTGPVRVQQRAEQANFGFQAEKKMRGTNVSLNVSDAQSSL